MEFIICEPLKGIDDIKFGMLRADLRGKLGVFKEFLKSQFSKTTVDDFGFCHVYYNENNQVDAIEVFNGTAMKIGSEIILPSTSKNAYRIIKALDKDVEVDGEYYTSIKLSIGITCENNNVSAILLGKKDYYK